MTYMTLFNMQKLLVVSTLYMQILVSTLYMCINTLKISEFMKMKDAILNCRGRRNIS